LYSWAPRIFKIKQFLSEKECNLLLELAQKDKKLVPVKDYKGPGLTTSVLAGKISFFDENTADIDWLTNRISRLTHTPVEYGENLAVIKYEKGDFYMNAKEFLSMGQSDKIDNQISRHGNRMLVLMMFLNDDYTGGHIVFPHVSKLTLRMHRGDALLFHVTTPKAEIDTLVDHSGTPILSGEKWVATKWIREKKYRVSPEQALAYQMADEADEQFKAQQEQQEQPQKGLKRGKQFHYQKPKYNVDGGANVPAG
jgi:prolyl 4-hydroxylase